MSSNARQTRTAGSTDARTSDAKTSRSFMEAWVEPPLRPPAPSFLEYPHLEIVRHGVLENMAPLGTMPSSKVKKLAKTDGPRRVTLVRKTEPSVSATSTPREAVTPEPPTMPSRRRSESNKTEDAEWNPTTPVGQTSARRSNVHDSVGRQSLPPQMSPFSSSTSPTKPERDLHTTDRAVDFACEEALAAGRLHTGYALRTLYDDHRSNPRIVKLFELIATQEASSEEDAEFRSLMRYKKKEGRTGGKAKQWLARSEYSFPSTPVHFSAIDFNSSPKRAPGDAANDPILRSPYKENGGHIHKKHKGNNYERQVGNRPLEVNGHGSMSNGTHLRTRSSSMLSSDSDLSSVDVELLQSPNQAAVAGSAGLADSSEQNTSDSWTATADDSRVPARNNHTQPMTRQRSLGPKLHAWDTNAKSVVPPASPSTTVVKSPVSPSFANHNNLPNSMPALLSDPFPPQPAKAPPLLLSAQFPPQPSLKSSKKVTGGPTRGPDEIERTLRLKRKARDVTENHARIHDSFDRHRIKTRDPESEVEGTAAESQATKSGQILRFRSSQASKRINDDSDDLSSPTLLSFQPDAATGSSSNSRAGTPGILNRPARKPKSGLRMKTSPMKKKAGPSAGIPRASGERNSPVGNGSSSHNQDDNDEYCSSCGGNGELVCCDGCTRSFHLRCVDPPLSENQLPDNWFCNACNASRNPTANDDHSVFGQLIAILRRKNPSAFHLPKDIRECFEGVRTGTEGEYEEGVAPGKAKRTVGYEEAPDYLKLKDGKGNFILCHECHKGAGSGNPVIPCTYCGLQWHLDCLNPPLANPPPAGKPWRCPCHIDDLLAKMPDSLGPAHRFRKIKGASIIKPTFPRGFQNNGHIEVELVSSDDEDDEGFFDKREYGKVYKLPEEGIKLDFISRMRSQVARLAIPTPPPEASNVLIKHQFNAADRHSILEKQAALNFAQFAAQEGSPDGAQVLIDALLAQAPPDLVAMVAQGDATNLASKSLGQREKQSLMAMKALIETSLRSIDDAADVKTEDDVPIVNGEVVPESHVDMIL